MKFSDKPLLNYALRLRRLRYLAIAFLLFLLIPIVTLVYFGFQQIESNLLTEYKREASNLVQVFDRRLYKKLTFTNTLPVSEFDYYQQVYNPVTKQNQQVLSPLSNLNLLKYNDNQHIKGLVGFFQYNSEGSFNSPIWPESFSIEALSEPSNDENKVNQQVLDSKLPLDLLLRKKTAAKIKKILSQSQAIEKMIQEGFDENQHYFSVILDVPDYMIFYRVASFTDKNRLQGYLVERQPYLSAQMTGVLELIGFNGAVLVKLKDIQYSGKTELYLYDNVPKDKTIVSQPLDVDSRFEQQILYNSKLKWPYESYEISLSTHYLPMPPATLFNGIFVFMLIAAILLACYGFYRLSIKQLILGEQRLNFVSSVSHELKTPLTSIQMYSQMLKEGTVISEDHRQKYFEFIYGESERLTRLINNILQLSALNQQQQNVKPIYTPLSVLQNIIRTKASSLIDKNSFQQNMTMEVANIENIKVLVEEDAFSQVIINITDNAVKFFDHDKIKDPNRQKIKFIFRRHPENEQMLQLEIRDYGVGITKEQESKIFELFYRGGNELTRTTQGTGIGLALVNGLVLAQHGEIKVERRSPGLAMLLSFHAQYE